MDSQKINNKNLKDIKFFKKLWYSMTKFEKYPEMAAYGTKRAIIYFSKLMLIFSILLTIVLLIYIKQTGNGENGEFSYVQSFQKILEVNLTEEEKQEVETSFNQYNNSQLIGLFSVSCVISIFIIYFITTLVDVLILSLFGLITCSLSRIKITYKAMFNMSIYAMTISILLRVVYEALLLLVGFKIKYFGVMYTAISYICLAAAIFMIKSDFIKQQLELMKIIEEKKKESLEKERKETEDERKEENEEKEEEKEKNKKKKEKGDKENNGIKPGEEEGANA